MLELIVFVLAAGFGGYGIGRTFASESIFEGWRQSILNFCYYPVNKDEGQDVDGKGQVYQITEDGDVEILSKDGYRDDIPRLFALILGKFADLIDCEVCLTAQSAFQLFLWGSVFGLLALELVALASVVGISYIILDIAT